MAALSLNDLVVAAQGGDREAFGELTKTLSPSVCAMLRARVRNEADVQDLLQDVFMHAMKKIHQLREPGAVKFWIHQMARRMAINQSIRKRRHQDLQAIDPENFPCAASDTDTEGLLFGVDASTLRKALAKLSPLHRTALVEHYLHGKMVKVMAREAGCPEGTIKRRLHDARKKLRAELAP